MKQNYNNESLARLGHGKWKSALGHTLLIIGMVLMSLGAYAQSGISSEIPAGLKMNKQWIPDPTDPTGSTGKVVLETYVTGSTISSTAAVPNDFVLVLDQSGSMGDAYGNTTRLQALKDAVTTFCNTVRNDAVANSVNHKIAIVGFATGIQSNGRWTWTNTELLSTNPTKEYGNSAGQCQLTQSDYQNALVTAAQNGTTGNLNTRITTAINAIAASGGTCMQYGLEMAYGVLSNRTEINFTMPDGTVKPRGQVVIFFTDGYPGVQFPASTNIGSDWYWNGDRVAQRNNSTQYNWISQTVADASVTNANTLKNNGAKIFSLGIFEGVDPSRAYTAVRKGPATTPGHNYYNYYYWEPESLASDEASGDAAANGLLHMISSNYDGENVALPESWSNEITSSANVANRFWHQKLDPDTGQPMYDPETGDPIMERRHS